MLVKPDKNGITHAVHTINSKGGRNIYKLAGAKYGVEVTSDKNMEPLVIKTMKATTTFFFARATTAPDKQAKEAVVYASLRAFREAVPWKTWSIR